jgi:hypothetical protein
MTKARDLANAGTALSAVSATELGYVDGVTSAIQTQIDAKIGSASAINPTVVDAKGDIIAATAADTVARLAVGANGTVLTAASGQATGLEWATPAAGGMTLLSTTTLSGASTTITVAANSYVNLVLILKGIQTAADVECSFTINNTTGATAYTPLNIIRNPNGPVFANRVTGTSGIMISSQDIEGLGSGNDYAGYCTIYDANSTIRKLVDCVNFYAHNSGRINGNRNLYTLSSSAVVSSIEFLPGISTWSGGTILLYGVK